jgi:hypothetical protein
MHPTLSTLETELAGSLTGLAAGEPQLPPRGQPGKWCIQQIADHLLLSYQTTVEVFEARIAKGTPTRAKPTLSQRLGQWYIVRLHRFPNGRKAPAAVSPASPSVPCSGDELIEQVQAALAVLDSVAERARKLFGKSPAISHIVLGPMSVDDWRTFHLVHGRHHIRQILALRTLEGPHA